MFTEVCAFITCKNRWRSAQYAYFYSTHIVLNVFIYGESEEEREVENDKFTDSYIEGSLKK